MWQGFLEDWENGGGKLPAPIPRRLQSSQSITGVPGFHGLVSVEILSEAVGLGWSIFSRVGI